MRDYLESGRWFLALCAASFTLLGILFLGPPFSLERALAGMVSAFFLILGIYSFNHITDIGEDRINKPKSAIVSGRKTVKQILFFSLLCKGMAIAAAFFISIESFVLVCVMALVGFAYSYRILGAPRLKDIFIVKSIVVSAVVGAFPALLILGEAVNGWGGVLTLILFLMIHILIGAITADLRDIEGDVKSGIRTIPAFIGYERTVDLLFVSNVLALVVLLAGIGFLGLKSSFLLLSLIFIWRIYVLGVLYEKKEDVSKIYTDLDCPTYLFITPLAVIGYLIGI